MTENIDLKIDNDLTQHDASNMLGDKTIEDVIKKETK